MTFLRVLLIFAILQQPFCGLCFAKPGSETKIVGMTTVSTDPDNDSRPKQTVYTKAIFPGKAKFKPPVTPVVDVGFISDIVTTETSSLRYFIAAASLPRPRVPLYLLFSILLN